MLLTRFVDTPVKKNVQTLQKKLFDIKDKCACQDTLRVKRGKQHDWSVPSFRNTRIPDFCPIRELLRLFLGEETSVLQLVNNGFYHYDKRSFLNPNKVLGF